MSLQPRPRPRWRRIQKAESGLGTLTEKALEGRKRAKGGKEKENKATTHPQMYGTIRWPPNGGGADADLEVFFAAS